MLPPCRDLPDVQTPPQAIDAQYHDRIFGIFQTLKAHDDFERTGLGLALIKKIVERQGGRGRGESQPGAGATLLFTGPLSRRRMRERKTRRLTRHERKKSGYHAIMMPLPSFRNKEALGDVWCRRCGHASRFGQWVPQQDRCPHCAGPGADRLPWTVLRLQFPRLPLRPVIGEVYRSFARK